MVMTFWKAIILGIVQGATEFLPVSSSGHLVLFQTLFGLKEGALTFDVFLHFGTLLAVIAVYWEDVKNIILLKKSHRHLTLMILIGIIPTGLIGVLFKDVFAKIFGSLPIVGVMWLVTGTIIWTSEQLTDHGGGHGIKEMKPFDAITIGLAQGLAIIPGISRSGSTIVAGLFKGLKRTDAARFSFLVSVPVILGATLLEAKDLLGGQVETVGFGYIVVGTIAAIVSGYLAIRILLKMLHDRSLKPFAYYCWILGAIAVLSRFV